MRRADWLPLAIVAGLGGFIVVQIARAPRATTAGAAPLASSETTAVDSAAYEGLTGVVTRVTPAAPADIEAEVRLTSRPAPRHDVEDVRRRLLLAEPGTYIPAVLAQLDSTLYRWPDRVAEPLRVWIDPRPPLAGWSEDNPALVRAAFREWEATGIPLRFTFVVNAGDADVSVKWVERFDGDRIGNTRWIHDQHRWMAPGSEIILALHHARDRSRIPPGVLSGVARHEIGHLLGLPHSPNRTDIMHAQLVQPSISAADRATARVLYSVPAGSLRVEGRGSRVEGAR